MKYYLFLLLGISLGIATSCKRCVQTDTIAETDGTLKDSSGTTFGSYTLRQNRINYTADCAQDTACNNFIIFKNRSARTITFTYRVQDTNPADPWSYSTTVSKLKGNDTTATFPQWTSGKCSDLFAPTIRISIVSQVKYE